MRLDGTSPVFNETFVGYGGFGTNKGAYILGSSPMNAETYFTNWGGTLLAAPVPLGTWTHLAAVTNGTLTTVYVNGNLAAAGFLSLQTATNGFLLMGAIPASSGQGAPLHGALDEISIYDRELSAAELSAIVAAPLGKCR